jgi:hypothetical protein
MGTELQAAIDKLDLVDVGHRAGLVFDKLSSRGVGACRDPFRSDDKHPSFQVVGDANGRAVGFKNYTSGEKGNLWEFACRCWPGLSKGELADKLIDMAGTRNPEKSAPKSAKDRAAEKRKEQVAQRRRVEERVSKQLAMPLAAVPPEAAYSAVYDRFLEGCRYAADRWLLLDALSERRGWPDDWVGEMVATESIGYPLLPWKDEGDQLNDRGWAFRVQGVRSPMAERDLEPLVWMGYHQQYYMKGRKSWVYCPYLSESNRPSNFQTGVAAHYAKKGFASGQQVVDPVPFLIGDVHTPRLVVIVEGQWDAVTLYGALGGFESGSDLRVLIFGLRGVSSGEQLFSYWGRWLRWQVAERELKNIWLLADNDGPGKKLIRNRKPVGEVPEVSFCERLKALLGCHVVASYCAKVNDFNDYYKENNPSVSEMWGLLEGLKLI